MSENNKTGKDQSGDIAEILRLLRESVESEKSTSDKEPENIETEETFTIDEDFEEEMFESDEPEELDDEEDPWYKDESEEIVEEPEELEDEEDPWYNGEDEKTVEELEETIEELEELEESKTIEDLEILEELEALEYTEVVDILSDENLDDELAEIDELSDTDEDTVLDETDINLLYTMGYKSIDGVEEVTPSSTPAKQIIEPNGDIAYNYHDEEYILKNQKDEIKLGYAEHRKNILIRLAIAGGATLLLLIYESIAFSGVALPWLFNQFKYPLAHSMISLQLLIIAVAVSLRAFSKGISDAFCLRSTPYSVSSVLILINVVYTVVVAIVQPENYALFNFSGAFAAVLAIAYEYVMVLTEEKTFDAVSCYKDKFYALVEDDEGDRPFGGEPTLRAYSTDFNKNFFFRMKKRSSEYKYVSMLVPIIVGVAAVAFGVFAIVTGNTPAAANTAMLVINFTLPLGVMGAYSLPMYQIIKELGSKGAIVGQASVDKYDGTRFVTFDETELFPSIKTTHIDLKPSANRNILEVLGKTSKLFSAIGGPLSRMVEAPDENINEYGIEIKGIFDDGIAATVDSSEMLVGGRRFLEINNVDVNAPSDYRDSDGSNEILYVSIDGKLAARYYIKYVPDKDFVEAVNLLGAAGISVGIRTRNPGVNSRIIEKRCPEMKYKVYTVKSVSGEEKDLTSYQGATDSGIVASGKAAALARPLVMSVLLKKYYKLDTYLRYASASIGVIIVVLFAAFGRVSELGSLSAIIYQVLWVVPSVLAAFIVSTKKKNINFKLKELFKK